jgi:hypothetical protein
VVARRGRFITYRHPGWRNWLVGLLVVAGARSGALPAYSRNLILVEGLS